MSSNIITLISDALSQSITINYKAREHFDPSDDQIELVKLDALNEFKNSLIENFKERYPVPKPTDLEDLAIEEVGIQSHSHTSADGNKIEEEHYFGEGIKLALDTTTLTSKPNFLDRLISPWFCLDDELSTKKYNLNVRVSGLPCQSATNDVEELLKTLSSYATDKEVKIKIRSGFGIFSELIYERKPVKEVFKGLPTSIKIVYTTDISEHKDEGTPAIAIDFSSKIINFLSKKYGTMNSDEPIHSGEGPVAIPNTMDAHPFKYSFKDNETLSLTMTSRTFSKIKNQKPNFIQKSISGDNPSSKSFVRPLFQITYLIEGLRGHRETNFLEDDLRKIAEKTQYTNGGVQIYVQLAFLPFDKIYDTGTYKTRLGSTN